MAACPTAGALGVWGRKASLLEPLREGDRVEVYRPLRSTRRRRRRQRYQGGEGTAAQARPAGLQRSRWRSPRARAHFVGARLSSSTSRSPLSLTRAMRMPAFERGHLLTRRLAVVGADRRCAASSAFSFGLALLASSCACCAARRLSTAVEGGRRGRAPAHWAPTDRQHLDDAVGLLGARRSLQDVLVGRRGGGGQVAVLDAAAGVAPLPLRGPAAPAQAAASRQDEQQGGQMACGPWCEVGAAGVQGCPQCRRGRPRGAPYNRFCVWSLFPCAYSAKR
jgi:hypothetical protein